MPDEKKEQEMVGASRLERTKAMVASALVHFKKSLLSPEGMDVDPPGPDEARLSYETEPEIRVFTEAITAALAMLEEFCKEIDTPQGDNEPS